MIFEKENKIINIKGLKVNYKDMGRRKYENYGIM
jgi:hypothetical protein